MNMIESERLKRIKKFIKKGQPKVSGKHFNWNQFKNIKQFKNVLLLTYDKNTDSYKIK